MEEFKGDKRSKEYKEWKRKFDEAQANESKGLGDTIEKITTKTGIKKAVKWLVGEDCGCDERKEKLNQIFRYKQVNCLNEDEYHFLNTFYQRNTERNIPVEEWKQFLSIFNRVFDEHVTECSSCSTINKSYYDKLKKVFDTYKA